MFELNAVDLDKVMKDLREFTPKLQKRGLNQAMRRSMAIVRDDARRRGQAIDDPSTPSNIPKEIQTQGMSRRKVRAANADAGMSVGIRGGARFNKNSPYPTHWRFVEFGTSNVSARPFMRPALETNIDKVATTFQKELEQIIDRIARTGK